jgi:type VI protein secretion system component VasF
MALAQMDRWLRQGFQALEQRTELPGEETISTMLRRLEPESVSQRRLRRAARTALWLGVLGFLLIAACALLALAYRVLNGS